MAERINIVDPHIQYDTAKQVCRMETENILASLGMEEILPV